MTLRALAIATAALLAGCAQTGAPAGNANGFRGDGNGGSVERVAQPGQVVAADIALSLAAQEDGRWKAFRDTAADDAILFVPQVVNARQWIKGRDDTATGYAMQPHEVWSSCDGTLSVSRGKWRDGSGSGWYVMAWRRQRDGGYEWTMADAAPDDSAAPGPEMIATHTAACPGRAAVPRENDIPPPHSDAPYGISRDGSLRWDATVADDCRRTLTVSMAQRDTPDRGLQPVLTRSVTPPGEYCGV